MALDLTVDHNLLFEEIMIDGAIKYVTDSGVITTGAGIGVSILQLLCEGLVPHHHL